ncbi:MAG: elongation factor Ts [Firmicutes bacterium HGW-Firmicutes-1]|jgi:elongation factor Ts|nr:MAG: elongation factor Ts [Firmicutes bacterium HGW-Firmicutes-1]
MAITAGMVKDLRERTGAGMLDCKKALEHTEGNIEKAIEYLREKGLSQAAKKASRIAAEGLVAVNSDTSGKIAAIVEVNSETDFVAKNDIFKSYVKEVADQAMATNSTTIEEFLAEQWILDTSKTVTDVLNEKISLIGEKLNIRRFDKMNVTDNGIVESYIHGGGRIGVIIEFVTDVVNDSIKECAKNIAMQVAAIAPKYVSRTEISEEFVEKEREILKQQAINENPDKPESIIDKMMVGRLNKQLKEICLVDQQYVKDGDFTVEQYVANVAKANGANLSIKRFVRFETGEGIEKKEENFAEEVARQIQQ